MEVYENKTEVVIENTSSRLNNFYSKYDGFKGFITTFMGVIVALIGMFVIFVIASLSPTRQIPARGNVEKHLLKEWEGKTGLTFDSRDVKKMPNETYQVEYQGKTYYFVIKFDNSKEKIEKCYFAYDGSLTYVFQDYPFYILTALAIFIAVSVGQINYTTSINSTMNTAKFRDTLLHYAKAKNNIKDNTQYIGDFCIYKNKQLYEDVKRDIIESADIRYEDYISGEYINGNLEKWQIKRLSKISKIKIDRIKSSDLLQENSKVATRISLLPIAPEKSKRNHLIKNIITKTISSFLSGLTVVFGIALGEWVLGITYGFMVFLTFIMSNIAGIDYANNGLRNRYIAKADLLIEFDNMIKDGKFVKTKQEETEEQETPIKTPENTQNMELLVENINNIPPSKELVKSDIE